MQHFQSILIVIGLFAIGGVLIHGYILSRKEKQNTSQSTQHVDIFSEETLNEGSFEGLEDGLGEVRTISNDKQATEENIDFSYAINERDADVAQFTEKEFDSSVNFEEIDSSEIKLANQYVEADLLSETIEENEVIDEIKEIAEIGTETVGVNEKDADDFLAQDEQPQDLFIFNVAAREGESLGGHELLQFFLTSGFRFGEMSIFHRHEHSDGTGPVLFSIANMMAPGVFEPENMEQFKSEGVSFFLTAPNEHIDIKVSFEMMLRAVEQMAEDFNCDVLNAQREPMTEAQFIEYNHRLLHYI